MTELTRAQIAEKNRNSRIFLHKEEIFTGDHRDILSVDEEYIRTVDSLNDRIEVLAIELKPWLESLQS